MKYSASCITFDKHTFKLILTGGSISQNGIATSHTWMIPDISKAGFENTQLKYGKFTRMKDMIYKRYAHGVTHLVDSVYAVGGYYHTDMPGIEALSM